MLSSASERDDRLKKLNLLKEAGLNPYPAKVSRDFLMCEADKKYPNYQFAKHKGYGTKLHLEMLNTYGPCAIHRRSFAPVKDLLK